MRMYSSAPSRNPTGSTTKLNSSTNPSSSPRRSARLNPPPKAEQKSTEEKLGSLVFPNLTAYLPGQGGSPTRGTRSLKRPQLPTRSPTKSTRSLVIEARVEREGHKRGRETYIRQGTKHNMKRKRPDGQDDERELDHGPRIKRTRHDEDFSQIVSMAEMPAVQIGLVEGASGGRVAEVPYQNEISWNMPSTIPQSIQGSRNPRNTLPFTWEADCREGSKANSRRSLRGLYEEVHWAERLHGLHRARDDDAGLIDQAQARIVAARDKLSSKVEEMVSGGSYFILKDVLGSQKPISFGFD